MKKYTMIGLGKKSMCCILKCLIPFDRLQISDLEATDFSHHSTDWCGCDKLERTLQIKKLELTGASYHLSAPLVFRGVDYDMGHKYNWTFEVTEILEVKQK